MRRRPKMRACHAASVRACAARMPFVVELPRRYHAVATSCRMLFFHAFDERIKIFACYRFTV